MDWVSVDVEAGAEYSFVPGNLPAYITDVQIGITAVDVDLILERGKKKKKKKKKKIPL